MCTLRELRLEVEIVPSCCRARKSGLRRMEFLLRREVEGESAGRAALTGTDDVPTGFRKLVDEYFKNLAGKGRGGGGGRP